MNILADSSADEATWLAIRRNYLTSSDLGAALGRSKYKTRDELHFEKVYGSDFKGNRRTWWGQNDEKHILATLTKIGIPCAHDGRLIQVGASRLAATLDGASTGRVPELTVADPSMVSSQPELLEKAVRALADAVSRGATFVVECKLVNQFAIKEWAAGPPDFYWCQTQAAMAALGASHGLLVARVGAHDLVTHVFARDEKFIILAQQTAESFMSGVDKARAMLEGM